MPKFYARKKSRMIVEKMEHSFVVKSTQGLDGKLHGKPGMFRVFNEDDPHRAYGIVDNDYIDRHYEILGKVGEEETLPPDPADVDGPEDEPNTVSPEEPELEPEDAPTQPEPQPGPEDGWR